MVVRGVWGGDLAALEKAVLALIAMAERHSRRHAVLHVAQEQPTHRLHVQPAQPCACAPLAHMCGRQARAVCPPPPLPHNHSKTFKHIQKHAKHSKHSNLAIVLGHQSRVHLHTPPGRPGLISVRRGSHAHAQKPIHNHDGRTHRMLAVAVVHVKDEHRRGVCTPLVCV